MLPTSVRCAGRIVAGCLRWRCARSGDNAVVHADYARRGALIRLAFFDDRLEIEDPGLLPFGLTVEGLRHGISKLRNCVIGRVFSELGLIEQWGNGIQRMTAACRDAGLADPVLEEIGMRFRVTLYMGRQRVPSVDRTDQTHPRRTGESERACHAGHRDGDRADAACNARLIKLIERGLVRELGSGSGATFLRVECKIWSG